MQVQNCNNNVSFKARFLFNGTEKETNSFVKFIAKEIKDSDCSNSAISLVKEGSDTFVLTAHDAEGHYLSPYFVDAVEFYDKNRKGFLQGIIDFDPIFGRYEKIHSKIKDGITSYYKTTHRIFPQIDTSEEEIYKMDFDKKTPLVEALEKLISSEYICLHDLNVYKNAVNQSKLKNLNVLGLSGVGWSSMVFNINNKLVLKLSDSPCYPEKIEPFDLPLIAKGIIPLENKSVYYCINPKGENLYDKKLRNQDVMKIIKMIRKKNHITTNDISPKDKKQIVMYKGKPYLCDYACARLPNDESRLVRYKWS